jgi:oxygen-independent coproporphyrinogen-3 oxidase
MNGIYVHIPFCKKVCSYCDFHFSVSLKLKDRLIAALQEEISLRKNFFEQSPAHSPHEYSPFSIFDQPQKQNYEPYHIHTLYFGGGTPSVLSIAELKKILTTLHSNFKILPNAEITLEANPDDLSWEYLFQLREIGFNRLSIGIQSFFDEDLLWMNRRHTASQAIESVKLSQEAGFENINIDLIYGIPGMTGKRWQTNLETFFTLNIPHLSAYHLTIEPQTVLGYRQRKGQIKEIQEDESLTQYSILTDMMQGFGFIHYEVSNFCQHGHHSRHNTNYWGQGRYLGIGPSAHSYDGRSRSWNVSVNADYIDAIENKGTFSEFEILSENDRFNDYLLTHLRTHWGIDLNTVRTRFGNKYYLHLFKEIEKIKDTETVEFTNQKLNLTERGLFISDRIISQLFYVD